MSTSLRNSMYMYRMQHSIGFTADASCLCRTWVLTETIIVPSCHPLIALELHLSSFSPSLPIPQLLPRPFCFIPSFFPTMLSFMPLWGPGVEQVPSTPLLIVMAFSVSHWVRHWTYVWGGWVCLYLVRSVIENFDQDFRHWVIRGYIQTAAVCLAMSMWLGI